MSKDNPFHGLATLDEVLLDVATLIELSSRDRRVAENRYRKLKAHLERSTSPLAAYLIDGRSMIYAQGSIATSTTIVSGTDDDRFDVDAVVEIDVPANWDEKRPLDVLEEALQGFPGVVEIVRCTRCVQLRFPFMHMDVTILDRRQNLAVERAGEIFHSPDEGGAYRVPSNPWGFTAWFRGSVGQGQQEFSEALRRHRATASVNRLQVLDEEESLVVAKAEQEALPPVIPNAIDAQEAVALKLLKRFINLHYENSGTRQPPSIYLAKRAADIGYAPNGLAAQLYVLANTTARIMRQHLAAGTIPAEFNPSYHPDLINDRWPGAGREGQKNMEACAAALEMLCERLNEMCSASLSEIAEGIDDLFGERIGQEQRKLLAERYDRRDGKSEIVMESRTGGVRAPAVVVSTRKFDEVPRHNFHPFVIKREDDE